MKKFDEVFETAALKTDIDIILDSSLTINKTLTLDGYKIDPSNAEIGKALIYNGEAFVPTSISLPIDISVPTLTINFSNVFYATDDMGDGYLIGAAPNSTASLSSNSANTSGIITFTNTNADGYNRNTIGKILEITFSEPYENAPIIILTPAFFIDASSSNYLFYVPSDGEYATTNSNWSIFGYAQRDITYKWYYSVIKK